VTGILATAWATIVILAMAVTAIILGGIGLAGTIGLLVCLAGLIAGLWRNVRGPRRVIEEARNEVTADTAVAMTCEPCNGKAGRCTCSSKCSHWLCGAADTGVSGPDFHRQLTEMLDREAGR
jgi:uncharacterized protein (DUF58 family)